METTKNNIHPFKRWKVGHHMFFVLIQGLILAHSDLLRALKSNNEAGAAASFNLATQLFWASTAAFKFGTDYTAKDYERIVRPTMGPPNYSEGFSDLQSVDHGYLLNLMSNVGHYFKAIPSGLKPAYQAYLSALHALYENHAYVCERFVGHQGESLLQKTGAEACNGKMSAPDSIRKIYKKRTLKYVENL